MMPCFAHSFETRVSIGINTTFLDKDSNVAEIAHQVQAAEFFQLFFFGSQALLYALALRGVISPLAPGIVTLGLLPIQALAYHRSMILYGNRSRHFLTMVACVSLTLIAVFSIKKMPGDYALTMCGGGFLVHVVRLMSERSDYSKKKIEKEPYQSQAGGSIKDRIEKARHVEFLKCSNEEAAYLAKKIQAAELFQLLYFVGMTVIFGLTLKGRITPFTAGICALSLLPFQIYANYTTMVLYDSQSRRNLTTTVAISLALMGIFSMMGNPGDYTWMLCLGSLLFHAIRLVSEQSDYKKALQLSDQAKIEI